VNSENLLGQQNIKCRVGILAVYGCNEVACHIAALYS